MGLTELRTCLNNLKQKDLNILAKQVYEVYVMKKRILSMNDELFKLIEDVRGKSNELPLDEVIMYIGLEVIKRTYGGDKGVA